MSIIKEINARNGAEEICGALSDSGLNIRSETSEKKSYILSFILGSL